MCYPTAVGSCSIEWKTDVRLKTVNNRRRNRQTVGTCPFCNRGQLYVRHSITDSEFIDGEVIKIDIRYRRCNTCDCGFRDYRDSDYAESQLSRKSQHYKLSNDKKRWVKKSCE